MQGFLAILVAIGLAFGARPVEDRPHDPHAAQLVHRQASVQHGRHVAPLDVVAAPRIELVVTAPRATTIELPAIHAARTDAPRPACSARGPPASTFV